MIWWRTKVSVSVWLARTLTLLEMFHNNLEIVEKSSIQLK